MNLTKEVKDLCNENYKNVALKINESMNVKAHPMLTDWDEFSIKMSILLLSKL